jgi:hypothetical protein
LAWLFVPGDGETVAKLLDARLVRVLGASGETPLRTRWLPFGIEQPHVYLGVAIALVVPWHRKAIGERRQRRLEATCAVADLNRPGTATDCDDKRSEHETVSEP